MQLKVGGHLSLKGNPAAAVRSAAEGGFTSMQIFASSPSAWRPPQPDATRYVPFIAAREQHGIEDVFIHAIYLINLASENATFLSRSKASLKATLEAGSAMRARGVVTHIGSHGGRGFDSVVGQISAALGEILDQTPADVDLILENSAGSGGIIGADLGDLVRLLERTGRPPRLKIALDTAHMFASGWNFHDPDVATVLSEVVEEMIGVDTLAVIHANDSLVECGTRRDRHANIGAGYIGLAGFKNLLAHPVLRTVPWVLETPNLDQRIDDRNRLQELCAGTAPSDIA